MKQTPKNPKIEKKKFLDEESQELGKENFSLDEKLFMKPIPKAPKVEKKKFLDEEGQELKRENLFLDISQITINSEETSNQTFEFSLLGELEEKPDYQEELEEKFDFLMNNYFGYKEGKLNKIRNILKDRFSDEALSKLPIENCEKLSNFAKIISEEFNSIINYIQKNTKDDNTELDCDYARGYMGEFEVIREKIDNYKDSKKPNDDSYEIILAKEDSLSLDSNADFDKLMEELNQIAGVTNNRIPGKNPKTAKTDQLEKKWLNKSSII